MIGILLAGVLVSLPLYPVDRVTDPISLVKYLQEEFTYKAEPEGEDYWQTPEETAKLKTFDCEDLAFYVQAVLKKLGYETKTICLSGYQGTEKYVHAICLVRVNGKWRYFSNQYYTYFKDFDTVTEAVTFECKNWVWYGEMSLPHNLTVKHFKAISGG
jgi:hypothetical protein